MNAPASRSRLLSWLPFLLPPLAFLFALWLQPPDHLGPRPAHLPWLGRLAYDDWDWTAIALRALNASLGRHAGREDQPEPLTPEQLTAALDDPHRTLEDRYYLEYPQTATWLFRLPYLLRPLHPPPALCDASYGDILAHRPRNDAERQLWSALRRVMQLDAAMMLACLLLLMLVVRLGYEPDGELAGPVWLLILPGALYFALNRFDVLPALLTTLSFACLGRRHLVLSALFLAAATLVKVYPLLLAPLIVRYLFLERRAALTWTASYGAAALALLLLPLLETDWQAVLGPYRVQLARAPMGPSLYGWMLPPALGTSDPLGQGFRFGTLALVMLALLATRPADLADLLRRGAIAVIVFANLSVFYSPQWILWFLPLLAPLAGRDRRLAFLVAGLDIVTYLTFPLLMDYTFLDWLPGEGQRQVAQMLRPVLFGLVIWARIVILAAILIRLARPPQA